MGQRGTGVFQEPVSPPPERPHFNPMLIRQTTEQLEKWEDDDIASSADAIKGGYSLMNMSKPVIGEYESFNERPPMLPSNVDSMLFDSEIDKVKGDIYQNRTRDVPKALADDSIRQAGKAPKANKTETSVTLLN